MLEALSDKLQTVFRKLGSRGTVSEQDLDEAMREVRVALLEADVNFKVVRQFIATVRERALGAEVIKSLTGPQQVIAIVNEELVHILGDSQSKLQSAARPPTVIMLVGLKGSGKTTTAAKLAAHFRKAGGRPLLVAADPYRVAGAEQLRALGRQLNTPVFSGDGSGDPARLGAAALEEARRTAATAAIVDTAGYAQLDEDVLDELGALRDALSPHEVLLVLDAMTGQEAVHVAEEFQKAVGVTGIVLSKMDGDARGGAALSIRAVTGLPVKFIGTGEKVDALEPFFPDRLASRLLGMGDVLTLVEKARESITEERARALEKKIRSRTFDLEDFLEQMQRVQNMGSLGSLLEMIPGLGAYRKQIQAGVDETFWKRAEAVIYSMTPAERRHPEIIDGSRRRRIARGSGTTPQDVNRLLNQWKEARKLMQTIAGGRGPGMLRMFR